MADNPYPQQGDIVVATVKKTTDFGAFCSLDEFTGQDAFIHISEVSSGWVRSVREHVKEGQRIVALVIRVDTLKRQIDLSLKRISEAEKKRKMEAYNLDKRAAKLLERVALKINKNPDAATAALNDIKSTLKTEYGDLYTVFELASEDKELSKAIPAAWATGIATVAKVEIKQKQVTQRTVLKLKCYASDGVEQIKKLLKLLGTLSTNETKIEVHYLGAPNYYVDITTTDYKAAEKILAKAQALLTANAPDSVDFQIAKKENASK